MTGYCLKCRASGEIQNPQAVTLKNGGPALTAGGVSGPWGEDVQDGEG